MRVLKLKSEIVRYLTLAAQVAATNSSQCRACSCEQQCEQVRR